MPTVTAPATSSLLQRIKTSYSSGAPMFGQPSTTAQTLSSQPLASVPAPAVSSDVMTTFEPPSVATEPKTDSFSTEEQLSVLDQVLTQLETTPTLPAQAVPLAISQTPDSLNPVNAVGAGKAKERFDGGATPDTTNLDVGSNVQVVEVETAPELPVEVEGYLQHVEQHQTQLPPEVVIASDVTAPYIPPTPLTPVVVLPITQDIEKTGGSKNPHWSVRWLVEWSRKLMKVFSGAVVYAESETK